VHTGRIFNFDFCSMYTAGYLERTHPTELFSLQAQLAVQSERISPRIDPLPFFHPAYEALLFVPFSLLSYTRAYTAFILLNVALAAACVMAARSLFSVPIPVIQRQPGLMVIYFFPMYMSILEGQDSILFLLALLFVWRALERDEDRKAGLILALAVFKLQIVVPLALLLAIRRGRRFTAAFLAGTVCVSLLSYICSPVTPRKFLHLIQQTTQSHGTAGLVWYIQPRAMANLRGIVDAIAGNHVSAHSQLLLTGTLSLVVLCIVAMRMRRIRSELLAFAIALLACLLTSYHLYPHDLTALAIPVLAIARDLHTRNDELALMLYLSPLIFFVVGTYTLFLEAIPIALVLGIMLVNANTCGDSGQPANAQ
jgi:hypothetical protein